MLHKLHSMFGVPLCIHLNMVLPVCYIVSFSTCLFSNVIGGVAKYRCGGCHTSQVLQKLLAVFWLRHKCQHNHHCLFVIMVPCSYLSLFCYTPTHKPFGMPLNIISICPEVMKYFAFYFTDMIILQQF